MNPQPEVTSGTQASGTTEATKAADFEPATPAVVPGGTTTGQVAIAGTTIDYVTVTPAGFALGDNVPVMLAFPPGGQDLELTLRIVHNTYEAEAVARGWVVVSPAAPDRGLFFRESADLVPGLMAWIETWVEAEGGAPHVVGVANGGLSAFTVAVGDPDSVQSLLVFPGFPRDDASDGLEALAAVPVRMFVGETDVGWVGRMQDTLATLEAAGGDVTLEIIAGEGHIITSLSSGERIFDELDALR